jgi:hypothetical protein
MIIVNEDGDAMVNTDNTFAIGMGRSAQGEVALIAMSGGLTVALASGGDRPVRAAEAIINAHKHRFLFLDLNDLLGAKPDIVVPTPGTIVMPHRNGKGQ